jgi:hypothetical protein
VFGGGLVRHDSAVDHEGACAEIDWQVALDPFHRNRARTVVKRRCTRCHRRPPAPGHTRCRPCKNRQWSQNRPAYRDLPEWQRRRHIARSYANVYQQRGEIKPKPCKKCGTRRGVQKHHTDYRKPLAVIWLCARDHRREHASINQQTTA